MGFDFFTQPELPTPTLSEAELATICEVEFGLTGSFSELGSQQDQNFLLTPSTGDPVVIKVVNPAEGSPVTPGFNGEWTCTYGSGAGAVVTKSVKPYAIVAGNPARVVGTVPTIRDQT